MPDSPPPTILVIDDAPGLQRSTINSLAILDPALAACFTVCGPDDITETHLKRANLVLVDYKLDAWKENAPDSEVCKHVPNGLALASILQQRVLAMKVPHAVAFAIHSGHLPELTAPFPFQPRIHMIARTCNVDWAFEKTGTSIATEPFQNMRRLAEAVQQLPQSWPQADSEKTRQEVERLLRLNPDNKWAEQAWSEVERGHPPLDELVHRIHGLLFLRWILHRIMSYPCFLLDEHWLAARLAVTKASLQESLLVGLEALFKSAEYHGILAGIKGRRWWRIGVEFILWELGGKKTLGTQDLKRVLMEDKGLPLKGTDSLQPVVCLDTDFQPVDRLHDPDEAVRILPDDWPPYAEQPWATIELALSDKRTAGLVIEADRSRLISLAEKGDA